MPKEIFVFRHDPQNALLPGDIVAQSIKRIGSVLEGTGPLRGLSFEEEEKYLPQVIGVAPNSPDFSKATTEYWRNLTIAVPVDGYRLNIGLREGEPESVEDYVKYQWLLRHPEVAESRRGASASFKARYYLYDPEEEVTNANRRKRLEMEATNELTKVLFGTNPEETLHRLTRVLISQNPLRLSREQTENALMDYARTDPEKFLETIRDKKLELYDLTIQLVEANVVQKIGEQYRYNDDTVAGTLEEMVVFLANKSNSRVYSEMKAKLAAQKP